MWHPDYIILSQYIWYKIWYKPYSVADPGSEKKVLGIFLKILANLGDF